MDFHDSTQGNELAVELFIKHRTGEEKPIIGESHESFFWMGSFIAYIINKASNWTNSQEKRKFPKSQEDFDVTLYIIM